MHVVLRIERNFHLVSSAASHRADYRYLNAQPSGKAIPADRQAAARQRVLRMLAEGFT